MSTAASTRPSRRAANRRKVVDSEDEEDETIIRPTAEADDDDENDYTPQQSPRRRSRRQSEMPTTPLTARRIQRSKSDASPEPSELPSPTETEFTEPTSPTKDPLQKRKRAKEVRQSRASFATSERDASPETPQLPTPKASKSPEPALPPATPLADITHTVVNAPATTVTKGQGFRLMPRTPAVLERPMDIMVRKRASAMPVAPEPAVPKARTVITYLVLTNFKSYAGRQEVGPFHSSFSSVVGPNGSGKSNVIDSLLFVFGFRASKMRQGKISALIHSSAAQPDLEFCEVEVHFQEVMDLPGGNHEVVPESNLVISRKAFRNNSSKYYIDGRESTFTAVTTLLKDKGVDLDHKRFLILQGEVESIAQMKPKAANEHDDGLLEYLEDIIGTSKYKTPIDEAAAEAEALNEVCMEKSNRVQHVEREKNSLEDKKNTALAFIRNENELVTKQSALYQIYIQECNDNLQVTAETVNQVQSELDEELRSHKSSEEVIKQLEKKYKASAKEYDALDKRTQATLKEYAKLDRETVKFDEKRKFLAGKQKKMDKSLQASKFAMAECETTIKQCTEDIQRNTAQIEDLERDMLVEEKELASIRDGLRGKTQGLSDQIAKKEKSLEPWKERINAKQSAIALAQSELNILREKDSAGDVAISELETKTAGFGESKVAKSAELKECKSQKEDVEKEAKKVQTELEELAKQEPSFRSKLSGARQKADEARASLSATQTQGNVLTGLMRLKESGRIDGFHGRLGNLGAIDQKLDIAISTACPSLDNLVVDSVEVGQQCIDYLRKNNLGRANFILLDRLPQRDLSAVQTPENVSRLFDLVKSKHERFKPAFYSVLQNTLVAKDLDQANRIAYGAKRWRVVTLDGQLIDKSGTMSGGGTRVARGGMSSKIAADVSKEQVSKLEVDRDQLEKDLEQLQIQMRELESNLKGFRNRVPKLDTQAQKLALELESFDRNITDAQRRIADLKAEQQPSKTDRTRMTALEKSIAALETEVSKLNAETADVEDEIKALQDKIMEIGGVRLRGQKAKVDGLKEQVNTLADEMSNAEVARVKAEKQKTKHEKVQADAAGEMETIASELAKVEQETKSQNKNTAGSKQQAEDAQEALETKKEELQVLKAELDTKRAELNETRGVEIEMRNKLEENQKILQDNQKRLRHWEEKINKLSLQNINDLGEESEAQALQTYSRDELHDMSKNDLKASIANLEASTSSASVDLSVLADYRKRVAEHASRTADLATAISGREAAATRRDDLRRLRLEGFMTGFATISSRLKEMYQLITLGGNAELELVDSLDPFAEGILFSVMPPKKSWKNIANLSGGEKTLSSLALVFALHHYKPTPLYVMDEIDAALDFRNVSIVASYIKERTKNAQFIVISLRNNMFELAARLVGVYKVNHMTKSVTVENRDYIVGRS